MSRRSSTLTAPSCSSPESVHAARRASSGQIRNGQQRAPVVGGAIVQNLRHGGIGLDQLVEVVRRPSRRLAAQAPELLSIAPPQALDIGVPRFALERDGYGAVLERICKLADRSNRLRRPSREPAGHGRALDLQIGGY